MCVLFPTNFFIYFMYKKFIRQQFQMNENAYDGLPSNKTSVILAKDAPHLKRNVTHEGFNEVNTITAALPLLFATDWTF